MNHTEIRVAPPARRLFFHAGASKPTDFFTPEQLSHAVCVRRTRDCRRPAYLPEKRLNVLAQNICSLHVADERHVAQLAHACNDDVAVIGVGALLDTPPKRRPSSGAAVCRWSRPS